ncbi:DUF2771 family protein [Gordonia rhizosphera]|uniref:DUF2771 domain-containing protein n=1 Tax=Gordonia rhizosphera NBRC 16068 TaxID=1108045 RepID=K6W936_9ACTN|nr:DUF2771 family protein [Gordonia rhizosphera]GAB88717.1 hypothetical protein GORHZ_037_00250 [Gordonia rhizosphera NBRC 16068]
MNSGDKKAIAIIAAVAIAFVVIVGGAVAILTRDQWSEDGNNNNNTDDLYLQLAVGDRLVRVEPTRMCDVYLKNCEPKNVADIHVQQVPVPVSESVMLSVSKNIAKEPWNLVVQYLTPWGLDGTSQPMRSNTTYTTVLHSTPERILVNIEVQLPSVVAVQGDDNGLFARGFLAADTAPQGVDLPTSALG